MKINFLLFVLILCAAGGWTYFSDQRSPNIRALDAAPNFEYVTTEGEKGSLAGHKDKPVLIHFWATWCAPCLVEFPDLMSLATAKPKEVIILAVAVADEPEKVENFLNQLNMDIPANVRIILDPEREISKALYGTVKLPETYVISRDMKVIEHIIGAQDNWNSEAWKERIERLAGA